MLQQFFNGTLIALLGAGLAAILPGIGSAKGVGMAGEAATGITAEDPSKFGQTLLLQALPGTQGIYGFLISFITLTNMGIFSGTMPNLTLVQGLQFFAACMPVTIVCYYSAIYQARVSTAAMNIVAKKPEHTSKGMIYAGLVETYAVLSLLASFLMVSNIHI
jgi:V/A-type H+-transporting ATPase subunit K